MGILGAIIAAVVLFVVWQILSAVGPALPYGLGAFIILAGILSALRDVGSTTTASAIVVALVVMLLAMALNDQQDMGLYLLAVLVGIGSLFSKSKRYL